MNRKKLMLTMAGLMSLSVALTACGGGSGSGSSEANNGDAPLDQTDGAIKHLKAESPDKVPDVAKNRKDTLVMGIQDNKGVFNPLYTNSAYDQEVCKAMFSDALVYNEDASFRAGLCDMPKISEDGKTFTFKLKDGVKWSDGEPITSDDMELYFKILGDKAYTGNNDITSAEILGYTEFHEGKAKDISGIKKIDKQTLAVTVKEVNALTLTYIAPTPMPNHYYGKAYTQGDLSKVEALHREPKVTSGPYKFVSYKPGEEVDLEANENFYLGKPKIKNLIYKTITPKTQMAQLQAGEIDFLNPALNPESMEQIKDLGFVDTLYYPYNGYSYIGLNFLGNSKLKDLKVRQALMYAVDRQKYVDTMNGAYGEVLDTPLSKASWSYPKDGNFEKYEFNLDKAAKLFEEAGWKKNSAGKLEKDGEVFKIRFLQSVDSEGNAALIPIIKSGFESLGIEFIADQFDFNTVVDKLNKAKTQDDFGNFDMWSLSWQLVPEPDPTDLFATTGSQNRTAYSNPKLDELMKKEIAEIDQEKRKPIFKELAEGLNKDLPYLFLNQRMNCYVTSSRIKGFKDTSYDRYYNYLHELTLE
ncbi:ABC transporter substrate-binding protein [Clostridium frigidicarnis]|uniref:Peptide/nickel transport system substrate-binding protein n=1 Tax=Clostridium frigidicarnis TaxID=84698 RepID=A0A1I1B5D1_9CLOT|nr:ABC transporter substrate-binding protein [Clostridium frigidicarnis]SFB44962.1 peptide/nickel transport system substrate-binding protein [Clostridium frigidicarnis]